MNYTDAHCHICPALPAPTELAGRICCTTREAEWDEFVTTANTKTHICVGIHPWYIANINPNWETHMRQILSNNQSVMVGEIGLDKYHNDMPTQIEIFTRQIEIAAEFHRAIQLHCVGAWDTVMRILTGCGRNLPPAIIAHAFGGHPQIINKLAIEYNMYFSYQTPKNDKTRARIAQTPLDRLLIETDTTTPGQEIDNLTETIRQISHILGQSTQDIQNKIYTNFQKVISNV